MPSRSKVSQAISEWQKNLLQLDRRNKLLSFTAGRIAVQFPDITPTHTDKWLQSTQRTWNFEELQTSGPAKPGPLRARSVVTGLDPADLRRRLTALHRRDREWEEEQGLNVLFLAVGFLEWRDPGGVVFLSPLTLVPCDLIRRSLSSPWVLEREEDVPEHNPTLAHHLRDQEIELPRSVPTIPEYLDKVRDTVSHRPEWVVHDDVWLSIFSFSKMAMYEDLEQMRTGGVDHPLILQLAGVNSDAQETRADASIADPGQLPADDELTGGRLDDLLPVGDQFTVFDADSSQLRAVHAARTRTHLVIHGPPGTGKSQTITNLIATLLADGRRVLFVSEKTAALDVVKRRLDERDLGVFCLDLHSDRGRKHSVYSQLRESLQIRQPRSEVPERTSVELGQVRDTLNAYVRALHCVRKPLGRSVFAVQGDFSRLHRLPNFDSSPDNIALLDADMLRSIQDAAEQISRLGSEFLEHQTGRWTNLTPHQLSVGLADEIKSDMDQARKALQDVPSQIATIADSVGLATPKTLTECEVTAKRLDLLAQGDGIPAIWVEPGVLERLEQRARDQARRQEQRRALQVPMRTAFGSARPEVDLSALSRDLDNVQTSASALATLLGPTWEERVMPDPTSILRQRDALEAAAKSAASAAGDLSPLFGKALTDIGGLSWAVNIGERILKLEPVPSSWLRAANRVAARPALGDLEDQAGTLRREESDLDAKCYSDVLEVADREMRLRFVKYGEWFGLRRLGQSYKRDRKHLLDTFRDLTEPPKYRQLQRVVEAATSVQRRRDTWARAEDAWRSLFGNRYAGNETNVDGIRRDLEEVDVLHQEFSEDEILRALLTTGATRDALRSTVPVARQALDTLNSALSALARAASPVSNDVNSSHLSDFSRLASAAGDAGSPLRALDRAFTAIEPHLVVQPASFTEFSVLIDAMTQLGEIEEHYASQESSLRSDFGNRFDGPETDWAGMHAALRWTSDVLRETEGCRTGRFIEHLVTPAASADYADKATDLRQLTRKLSACLGPACRHFLPDRPPQADLDQRSFADLLEWAEDLSRNSHSVTDWVPYVTAVASLEEHLGRGALGHIRDRTPNATRVPGIVLRRVYLAWLSHIHDIDPVLRAFDFRAQDSLRDRFRRLDADQDRVNRDRVRSRCFARYPDQSWPNTGELRTLRGELSKKRRQLPVRRLIQKIPHLLQTIKPCMLMSPLAVSQYLPRDSIQFDTVIFDEASQVFPEDAIPAISRVQQVIVAGDNKQLPPTNFFRKTRDEDDDWTEPDDDDADEEPDRMEGRESILAVMVGMVGGNVGEAHLTNHYRSRHDDLIRYSNHYFYDDRLLVFPAPGGNGGKLGLRDIYVQDGRFDAGASRTNRREADRVVDLVFETMRSNPAHESVGVVALSRSQADLIETLVETRRSEEPDIETLFDESRMERFFVKNLENVQGDERDHVILSVGYGPTVGSGAVPQRFGPINNEGGDRRLNVAVTRARRSMTVVRSLRASDISRSSRRIGPQRLRQYLEYAADPKRAIERGDSFGSDGGPESPFEEAVLRSLVARGHDVVPQVGVAGYRIDLGIRSDSGDGFDLGIECDGARYHSAPSARDRDRLRQGVLEGLGWTIHRVWSTAWARSPDAQLADIERALARARSAPRSSQHSSSRERVAPKVAVQRDESETADLSIASSATAPLFQEYKEAHLDRAPVLRNLLDEPDAKIEQLVRDVGASETPVHMDVITDRLRQKYGEHLTRASVSERVKVALQSCSNSDRGRSPFFVMPGREVVPRRPTPDGLKRTIDQIADSELEAGILLIVQKSFQCTEDELIVETARQFGFGRTGWRIRDRLIQVIAGLKAKGLLRDDAGSLIAASSGAEEDR